MDEKMFRFWSDFFRQAAEGQARVDEIRHWMESGMRATGEIREWFQKWIEQTGFPGDAAVKPMEEFMAEFNRAIQPFIINFGMVPKTVYLELEEKYNALKQRAAEQEETIRRLRRMVADKEIGGGAEEGDRFAELLAAQQQQFRQWMEMFTPGSKKEGNKENGDGS